MHLKTLLKIKEKYDKNSLGIKQVKINALHSSNDKELSHISPLKMC